MINSTKGSTPKKKQNLEKNYKVYCVNVNGSCLRNLINRFQEQVGTALRSTIFTIDLEHEISELLGHSKRHSLDNSAARIAVKCIEKCLQKFSTITSTLQHAYNFDLYEYWLKDAKSNPPTTTKKKGSMNAAGKLKDDKKRLSSNCIDTIVKEHNRIGTNKILQRDIIKDSPWDPQVFIIIFCTVTKEFITDLIKLKEPVKGIIEFYPDMCISKDHACKMFQYRDETLMKNVGIYKEYLPVFSQCIAKANASKIYNELTWLFYDKELLYEYYLKYYFQPFIITNVSLDESVDLQKTRGMLQSDELRDTSLGSAADLATIAHLLEHLISLATETSLLPNSFHRQLLTTNISENVLLSHLNSLSELTEKHKQAFLSITKIKKYERVVIENANSLLVQLMQYCDQRYHNKVYATCLEYGVLRDYVVRDHCHVESFQPCEYYLRHLPHYFRFLGTADSTVQTINSYIDSSDDYSVSQVGPEQFLYTFRRCFDTIIERSMKRFIPSRLCFRDFTIYQLDEFREHFNMPPIEHMFPGYGTQSTEADKKSKEWLIDESIFIRIGSLKARQPVLDERRFSAISTRSGKRRSTKAAMSPTQNYGLPTNHTLLRGYNFEDTRQEVCVNTARYNFEEGFVELYTENWCGAVINRFMRFSINKNLLILYEPPFTDMGIEKKFYFISKNDMQITLLPLNADKDTVVINCANGLMVHKHKTSVEQLCRKRGYLGKEKKRIHSSSGAIIVFYENHTVIMRGNGEIYELFNYDPTLEQQPTLEEEVENSLSDIGSKMTQEELQKSVKYEMEFFRQTALEFDLKFMHLIITTSTGRVIHKNDEADIYETAAKWYNEWHDYETNEYLTERADKVKLIWTSEYLRCFFGDGTVITTYVAEEIIENQDTEEFELICFESWGQNSWASNEKSDLSYMAYDKLRICHQHEKLFEVVIKPNSTFVAMDIFGPDNLSIIEEIQQDTVASNEYETDSMLDLEITSKRKSLFKTSHSKTALRVSLDQCIILSVTEDFIELDIILNHITNRGTVFDPINFCCNFNIKLHTFFKEVTQAISEFKIYNPKIKEHFILKKTEQNLCVQGLEFLNFPPKTGKFCHHKSNTIIEFIDIQTVDEKVLQANKSVALDLNKFPRFPSFKKKFNLKEELPMTVGVNLYVKIPCSMSSVASICKFSDSLGDIDYKKMRPLIKEALINLLCPWIDESQRKIYSDKSWELHQDFELKRSLEERQRLGFYIAMLKYKKYPTYEEFYNTKCMGRVQNLNIIDFFADRCFKSLEESNK